MTHHTNSSEFHSDGTPQFTPGIVTTRKSRKMKIGISFSYLTKKAVTFESVIISPELPTHADS
jgi:hypothetical protein